MMGDKGLLQGVEFTVGTLQAAITQKAPMPSRSRDASGRSGDDACRHEAEQDAKRRPFGVDHRQ